MIASRSVGIMVGTITIDTIHPLETDLRGRRYLYTASEHPAGKGLHFSTEWTCVPLVRIFGPRTCVPHDSCMIPGASAVWLRDACSFF